MESKEEIPAYSMWKMFNETIPLILNMESSESNLKRLTNILDVPEFSDMFLYNTSGILTFQQHDDMSKKYKAFTMWLLGRFFHILSQMKLARIHDLIIDTQKRILSSIEITQGYIYHELTKEYTKVLEQLNEYFAKDCEGKIQIQAFIPEVFEDLDLDLSPIFVEVSSNETCIYMQKVTLKIIEQIILEKMEFHYIKSEVFVILDCLFFILKNSCLELKLLVLEIYSQIFNYETGRSFEVYSIFQQLAHLFFLGEFPKDFKRFQKIACDILKIDFGPKKELCEFILKSKQDINEDLMDVCVNNVGEDFEVNCINFKLCSVKISEETVPKTWCFLQEKICDKFKCYKCDSNCKLDEDLIFIEKALQAAVEAKITNTNFFIDEASIFPFILDHIVNHIQNCKNGIDFDILARIIINLVFLSKTKNLKIFFHIIGFPFLKPLIYQTYLEFPTNYSGYNDDFSIKKNIKFIYAALDNQSFEVFSTFQNFIYFMNIALNSENYHEIEENFFTITKKVLEDGNIDLQIILISVLDQILSSSQNPEEILNNLILPLLISQNLEILKSISKFSTNFIQVLTTPHSYNPVYSKALYYKLYSNNEGKELEPFKDNSKMVSLIKAFFNLLGKEDDEIRLNVLKVLPVLSRNVGLFHRVQIIKWMSLLVDKSEIVRKEFAKVFYKIVLYAQENEQLLTQTKYDLIENLHTLLHKATKKSLQSDFDLQETILSTIESFSKISHDSIPLHTMKLLLYFIMIPTSRNISIAINILTELPKYHNTTISKLYRKHRRELCKIIVDLCAINKGIANYNLATSLEKISLVLGFFDAKYFVAEEARYLLPLFIVLVEKLPEIESLIEEMAYFKEIDLAELLTRKYGYIFLHIVLNDDDEVKRSLQYVERNAGLDGSSLRKRNFMIILNELLLNFYDKKDRVLTALNHLAKEDFAAATISIPDFLQPRFLGVLQYFDIKLSGHQRKVLLSLSEIFKFMGPKHISPLRFKIIAMLRTALNLNCEADVNCKVWTAFIRSCDIEVLGPQLATIFVSIQPLIKSNPEEINSIFKYLVVENEKTLKDYIPDLFFVKETDVDYVVREIIETSLKPIKELQFKEHLKYFLKYLNYETNDVRIYGLKYIRVLLEKNREELDQMILGYNGIDGCVVELLDILTVCCRERDQELRLACGECIGELGAIEPSHLPRKYVPHQSSFNFFINEDSFIVNSLIELTRALQAEKNTQNMDRFALAIQETLKTYRISPDKTSPKHELWNMFPESQQELMLPLLSSKYTMAQAIENITVSPIYGSNFASNFQTWLYNWTVSLVSSIKSNKVNILRVCLPSMKQDLKTLMHFLPHILLHALTEGDREDMQRAFDEFMAVIQFQNNEKISDNLLNVRPIRAPNFITFEQPSALDSLKSEQQYTKVVFVLLDFLDRWLREWLWDKGFAGRDNENYKKVRIFLANFCKLQLAQCNFNCGEYPRALMYLEDYMSKNNAEIDENLSLLAKIYYRLDEPDGVAGVSALRQTEPNLEQRILALEVSGKLSDAAACYERLSLPMNLFHIQGLIRCYLDLDNVNTALNFAQGAMERQTEYTSWILEAQVEPLWRLGRYDELDKLLKRQELRETDTWGVQIGHALLHFKNGSRDDFKSRLSSLRMAQVDRLSAASLEEGAYQHGYFYISRLHALNELEHAEQVVHEILLRPNDLNVCQNIVQKMKKEWDLRLKVVQESVKITEPLLCLRRVAIEQAKKSVLDKVPGARKMFDEVLGECWLKSTEIARNAGIHQQAYTYVLKAEEYSPPKLFLEKAKLHWMREEHEQALTTLNLGLDKYFPNNNADKKNLTANFSKEEKKLCAEAQLLIASYNDSISNVDTDVNIQHYKNAMEMFKEWEKSLICLAQYYDRIFQNYPDEEKDSKGSEIQIHMINYFGKSLQYGTTYVYQSMPRLLSIWFDYGTRLLDVTSSSLKEERKSNLLKMTKLIDTFLQRLPAYIFLTAFSQLVSRICHPQKEVYLELKQIIIKLILNFPQQSLWMIISVVKSSYTLRSKRCAEILADSRLKTAPMTSFLNDFTKLAEKLIELCNKDINDSFQSVSVGSILRSLPRMLTKEGFSEIMMPTQMFRKLILPNPDFSNSQHNPFPNRYVYIVGIEDTMTILPSLQKPRKITLRGSDGKCYIQMLKPKDDLRKDFRLMEFNDIVNQLLSREADSRQRRLNIRLYSVVPLNEECGLIEWVPNVVCLRPVLMNLYKQRGLGMKGKEIKEVCCKNSDSLSKKREIFLNKLLPKHPPILGDWFRKTFPDPQSWLTARTAYIRTTAVISMVGYILGLGDRHGENILLDSTNGDTVHVDFNCLFNKGESFEWPERVPFRLTQNMVAAMGPLGVEGVFRKSCACTLRVLRNYTDTLMSIVTPFVYDPLVSWPRNHQATAHAQNAERTNELALDHIREIERRLQGQVRTKFRSFSIPLSVEGQTNNLILEAMSINNLCQMYIGWGPYL